MTEGRSRWALNLALALVLVILWLATHRYAGIEGDAGLYAVQALARIHRNLRGDVFLRSTSQDTYTIFSGFYAACIRWIGLRHAALGLTVLFKLWFFGAAWALARRLANRQAAFLAVASLIVVAAPYGAYGVFHYAEDWLTARTAAEALVVSALALHCGGWRAIALLVAGAAMLVHPLMALPGLLVLFCLNVPLRAAAIGAAAGVVLIFAIALGDCAFAGATARLLPVMDGDWLTVVRERSQFLFLPLWRMSDWDQNLRPFLTLALSATTIANARGRRLCVSAIIVGVAGLGVALIASVLPVAVLLQGQAWRWTWVGSLVAVSLLGTTVVTILRSGAWGLPCGLLMLAGWMVPSPYAAACLVGALVLWTIREPFDAHMRVLLSVDSLAGGRRRLARLRIAGRAIASRAAAGRRGPHATLILWMMCAALALIAARLFPGSLRNLGADGTPQRIQEFADWRRAIPPDASVLVLPAHNSASFAWFTLERPSYLTVDQSSGVVFSSATAREIRRRSQVLEPLMDPDWKLLSSMSKSRSAGPSAGAGAKLLTRESLLSICRDRELDFVVATENIDAAPLRHTIPGTRLNWNLYDCRRVYSNDARSIDGQPQRK